MATISVLSRASLNDAATNNSTSTVGEPSVAVAGQDIFVTGNWFASRSTDGGSSWTFVDPFNALPSAAGGFCCDQVVLHDASRGLWIWILQYIEQGGSNVFRIAACPDAEFAAGGWYWWDIAPTTVDDSWTDQWFDYPDAAFTDSNLVVTFNLFSTSGAWQRGVIMRFPLDTIASRGTLGFDSWSTDQNGSLRLTQGAGNTIYWGSHISTQQLRLFAWPDSSSTLNWWDITVAAYSETISSTAPNGVDWLGRADTRITGATVGAGVVTFLWTAGSGTDRPQAFCKVVRIDESTKQLIDQPDLYSTDRAWAYPAACVNADGTVGFTAFYGGGTANVGLIIGARDDAAGTWTSAYAQLGTDSPNVPKWGDYLTCRQPSPGSESWVAVGYTLQGGQTRLEIVPQVVTFGVTP